MSPPFPGDVLSSPPNGASRLCYSRQQPFPSAGIAIKLWTRAYRIQQRPVALFHFEAFGIGRPRFHAERPHDPVVPVIALQDGPGQVCQGSAAALAQLGCKGITPLLVEIGKRPASQSVEPLQHCDRGSGIASKALQNVAKDRLVTGAWYTVFGAGRDHHLGETAQRAALIGRQHRDLSQTRWRGAA